MECRNVVTGEYNSQRIGRVRLGMVGTMCHETSRVLLMKIRGIIRSTASVFRVGRYPADRSFTHAGDPDECPMALRKADLRIRAMQTEREALLKELHHRVKNNLQVISSLLNMQAYHSTNMETRKLLDDSRARIRSMAIIHENLYGTGNLAEVDFGEYVEELVKNVFKSLMPQGVRYTINLDKVFLDVHTAVPCGMLVNELVTNAVKHAFRGKKGGVLSVELRNMGRKYKLVVRDNGAGFPPGFDIRKPATLGITLVNALAAQLGGSIEVDSKGGTTVTVVFGS